MINTIMKIKFELNKYFQIFCGYIRIVVTLTIIPFLFIYVLTKHFNRGLQSQHKYKEARNTEYYYKHNPRKH
jgi:hypothetical protein